MSVSAQKTDPVLAREAGRGFEEGDWNSLASGPQALVQRTQWVPNTHHQKNRQPCSEFRGSPSSKATKPELQDRIPAAVPRNQAEVPALPASSTLGLVLNSFPPPASRQPASPHFPHGPCVPVSRNHPHECIHPFPPEIRLAASCPWCLKPDLAKSPQLGRGRNPGQEYSGRRSRGFPSPPPPPHHRCNATHSLSLQIPEQEPGIPAGEAFV